MLFEEKDRTYLGSKTYVESDFEYLDRSASKGSENIRNFLNTWLLKFPESEARELISRMTARDIRAFESAVFEIILFAIVTELGGILEVHPKLENNSNKRPDFLVTLPDAGEFYLEAVLVSEFSGASMAAEKRKNVVLEAIQKIESPNFSIGVHVDRNPDTPPRGKALRKELLEWLGNLDPDEVERELKDKGVEKIPTMEWEDEGWNVQFEAIPIRKERRGKGQRVIVIYSEGFQLVNSWKPIRDAIRAKGNKYGELSKPLIVAVSVGTISLDHRIDEMRALFGQEEYFFDPNNSKEHPEMQSSANGAWIGSKGPQYKRVSGAWIFGGINLRSIISRKNTLYFNPWANFCVPDSLKNINHAVATSGKMEWFAGEHLWQILQLQESWPE